MTNEDLLAIFDYFEKEKGFDRATMVEALESALLTASKKSVGPARELRVNIDPVSGAIKAIATLLIVDKVTRPYDEVALAQAQKINPEAELGGELDVEVTPANFGRIAAQTAKQAIIQKLRQAEKEKVYEEFKDRAGDIVSGTVRRFERSDVILDLGKFEASMPARERVNTEDYSVGDRIRAYVVAVENGARGPEVILSRSHPNFVRRLFEAEVTEISDHTVEIRSIAREAGYRTKVAVHSADEKIDPVGACVGLRGARVKNIVRELNNEKVDIIRWCDDPKEFVMDALKPAEIKKIEVDEANEVVRVTVEEEELSKAIGRRGQNARLTSRLLGWDVQIEKDQSEKERFEAQIQTAVDTLVSQTGIPEELAGKLVTSGITTGEVLMSVEASDIAPIIELSTEEAETILSSAKAKLIADGVVEQPSSEVTDDSSDTDEGEDNTSVQENETEEE